MASTRMEQDGKKNEGAAADRSYREQKFKTWLNLEGLYVTLSAGFQGRLSFKKCNVDVHPTIAVFSLFFPIFLSIL